MDKSFTSNNPFKFKRGSNKLDKEEEDFDRIEEKTLRKNTISKFFTSKKKIEKKIVGSSLTSDDIMSVSNHIVENPLFETSERQRSESISGKQISPTRSIDSLLSGTTLSSNFKENLNFLSTPIIKYGIVPIKNEETEQSSWPLNSKIQMLDNFFDNRPTREDLITRNILLLSNDLDALYWGPLALKKVSRTLMPDIEFDFSPSGTYIPLIQEPEDPKKFRIENGINKGNIKLRLRIESSEKDTKIYNDLFLNKGLKKFLHS